MSLIKKLAGETAIYGLSSIVGRLLNYLLVPFYTRVFIEEEYGVVIDLYAWVGLLMVFFTYRMETGFFRFGTPLKDRDTVYSTATFSLLFSTPVLCLLLIALAQPIANALSYPEHSEYIVWFALVLSFDALAAVPFARLRLDSRPWRFAAIKLTNIGVNIGANVFFLVLCPYLVEKGWNLSGIYDPNIGVGYVFISNLLASGITLLLLLPTYFQVKFTFDKRLLFKILTYTAPLVLVGLAGIVNEVLDRILLKWLLPYDLKTNLAMLGEYGAAYKLAMLMTLFTQAFNYAAEPFFFRNADRKDAKEIYAQVALFFTIVGVIGFLGIMLYIDIVQYFLGEDFREALIVVPILLLANLCLGIYYNFAIWYKLTDKTLIGAWIALLGAGITIGLNILWIPTLGYVGSAWATLICYAVMSAACYLVGRKYYPIPYPLVKMLAYIITGILLFEANLLFRTLFNQGEIYVVNTLLLLTFLGLVYQMEFRRLKKA